MEAGIEEVGSTRRAVQLIEDGEFLSFHGWGHGEGREVGGVEVRGFWGIRVVVVLVGGGGAARWFRLSSAAGGEEWDFTDPDFGRISVRGIGN